jgi:hypothetical protein
MNILVIAEASLDELKGFLSEIVDKAWLLLEHEYFRLS